MTFTDSLEAAWFEERHGRKVQAASQNCRSPSDGAGKTAGEYASYWKLEKFGLYPQEVATRVEDLVSKQGSRILDIGQGMSGLWLMSMAERFPTAECLGVDAQPLVAETVPANMTTELFDVSTELPYPDAFFDVINHSQLASSFSKTFTYENLCSEIARCLKPDGVYFFFEALKPTLFPENGDTMEKNFVAIDKFRFAQMSLFPERKFPVCSLSQTPYDATYFLSVLRSTDAFDPFDVQPQFTQFGSRGVDPRADRIGDIYYHFARSVCSPYFFLAAGYSEADAHMWTSRAQQEFERARNCKKGEGLVARHSLGWAVRKGY